MKYERNTYYMAFSKNKASIISYNVGLCRLVKISIVELYCLNLGHASCRPYLLSRINIHTYVLVHFICMHVYSRNITHSAHLTVRPTLYVYACIQSYIYIHHTYTVIHIYLSYIYSHTCIFIFHIVIHVYSSYIYSYIYIRANEGLLECMFTHKYMRKQI